jgi:tetratricopeptide (TPR) repeat protein
LLGIFESGEISTAEAAAAWGVEDRLALAHLSELIDLSLVRQVDAVTLRLHPLLADYARAMAEHLATEERTSAHCRVADYLFRIAPRPPRSISDMAIVLRSHYHAAAARDHDRVNRVYPWFTDGEMNVAVPGFLIDHGQHHTLVVHQRLALDLSEGYEAVVRSFLLYRLGDALQSVGELAEAEERMQQAVRLMEGPDADDDGRAIGLAKFLMGLGQVQAQLGKLDEAAVTLQRAVDYDRKMDAEGKVLGAHQSALIGLLQLADLFAQSNRPDGGDRAERICRDVHAEAMQHGDAQVAIMALARLANQFERTDPEQALEIIRAAKQINEGCPHALEGRQGARYARLLATSAMTLAFNGKQALDDALGWLRLAIVNAGRCDARQELGHALYQLGNLFEHYHLFGHDTPLLAAWACYALSESYMRENDAGSPLNAQFRIDERVAPRIEEGRRAAAAIAVEADPWALIDAELSPRVLGWRPTP